jgi:hypothetical protein
MLIWIRGLACFLLLSAAGAAEGWVATTWKDAPAWTAEFAGMKAIVAPAAGRLVWFGPTGGDNLLYLPPGGEIAVGGAHLHGGHQGWLGPQARWNWPPPPGWEAGAVSSEAVGDTVTLRLPANPQGPNPAPSIDRTYRITTNGLVCALRWRDAQAPWHAMHVLQVPRTMRIAPVLVQPTAEVPAGVKFALNMKDDVLFPGSVLDHQQLTIIPAKLGGKIFLPAQPLHGTFGNQVLTLEPVVTSGVAAGEADQGLQTQVYISNEGQPYLELEQCSKLLLPGTDGSASAEFTLRITPLQ